MSATYDFSGLTEAQQRLLTFQGWEPGCGQKQPTPRTVKKLIDRKLVVPHDMPFMGITVKAYDVPINVHAAWCEHCANTGGST